MTRENDPRFRNPFSLVRVHLAAIFQLLLELGSNVFLSLPLKGQLLKKFK